MVFFGPFIILFYQSRGLSLTEGMLLQSIYAIGVVILEVPTGVIADIYGKRKSLIVGALAFVIALICYYFSHSFWQFALSELIAALGMSFISGADSAFIHETLKSLGREGEYKKIEGRARGLMQAGNAVGEVLSGFVASISLAFTFLASAAGVFIAFLVSVTFSKPPVKLAREEQVDYKKVITESYRVIKTNRKILWLTLFFALFNGMIWPTNFISQPYLQDVGVPILYFGFIFAAMSAISAVVSSYTHTYDQLAGKYRFLIPTVVTAGALFLLGAIPRVYIFPVWIVFNLFAMLTYTLVSDTVLSIVSSSQASTVLSFQNLARRGIYAVCGPVIGFLIDRMGLHITLEIYGICFLILLMPLFTVFREE